MTDTIIIRPTPGTWVVRAGDAILAESTRAVELIEGARAGVIYLPRTDAAMALLEPSARRSFCPWKGEASYFSITTPAGTIPDAVWSYETPKPGCEGIAGHLAFHTDRVTLERV